MSSGIPFPHRVDVVRRSIGGTEDDHGNPKLGAEATVDTLYAWVQEKTSKQQADWSQLSGEISTHTIFLDPYNLLPGDVLVTLAGGGQVAGEYHRVLGSRNPDGGTDHIEVDTLRVGSMRVS